MGTLQAGLWIDRRVQHSQGGTQDCTRVQGCGVTDDGVRGLGLSPGNRSTGRWPSLVLSGPRGNFKGAGPLELRHLNSYKEET